MDTKTYSIGGLTLTPAVITAGQQKLVNRLIREAMQSCSFDAQGSDNPLLMYAVLWHGLVEVEGVTRMLSLILRKQGTEWSEEGAVSLQAELDELPFEDVTMLYNGAMTSFFADHPRLTSGITLSLVGYMKNSEALIARLQRLAGEGAQTRNTSTP